MVSELADAAANARVTCDMTPFGIGITERDATVVFGPNDDPESIDISIPLPQEQRAELYSKTALDVDRYFASPDITGKLLDNETEFKGRISRVTRMQPLGMFEAVRLSCAIDNFEFIGRPTKVEPSIAVFRLTNVPFKLRGDTTVVRPLSDRPPTPLETDYFDTTELQSLSDDEKRAKFQPGWQFSVSRINFRFGGRTWSLDTTQGYKDGKHKAAALRPMVTATLTTQADSTLDLELLADHICDLLTFAFGKEVQWVSCGHFSPKGPSESKCRSFPLLPYGKGAGAVIDNWEIGNLRQFIEQAESAFNNAQDWWHRSIGLLAHSRATPLLEIRLATLNTLMDRISNRVISNRESSEIDPGLPGRLNRRWFRWLLHKLLCTLSPKWDEKRTNTVCDTILQWNSTPSFPNQVVQACEALGVSAPARKKLGFRHKLIHVGEFDKALKSTEQMIDYLQSVEAVVELMMIRMLRFTGFVHIDERGPQWHRVDDLLSVE